MISILMPVYNTEPNDLEKSIQSCLNQTFINYELVIVNNQSDRVETLEVLEKYKTNKIIKVIDCPRQQDHKNISIALNYGLNFCNYELVVRMDSDDVMTSDRLEKQYYYLASNPEVDILGGQIIINNDIKTNHPRIVTKQFAAFSTWFLNHPTIMFRKSKIINIGGYKSKPKYIAEDHELWLRCLTNNYIIHNIPDVILYYKYHNNNETNKTQNMENYHYYMNEIINEFRVKNDIK